MRHVPTALVVFRALAAPAVLGLARLPGGPPWAVALIVAGLLSDIFDGVIARRLGVATEHLRVADSFVDAWFYVCLGAAAWLRAPDVIRGYRWPLIALLACQFLGYGIDLLRYGRIASFHAYSAKLWGLTLAIAAVALVGFRSDSPWLWLMIGMGFASYLDSAAIKLLLPEWRCDVHGALHALRLRREAVGEPDGAAAR